MARHLSTETTTTTDAGGEVYAVICACGHRSAGRSERSAWATHSRHQVRANGGR